MNQNSFFKVRVRPTLTATGANLGSITAGEVLFDWTAFQVPAGVNKLVQVSGHVRGVDGAAQRVNFEIYFNQRNTYSIGTVSATQAGIQFFETHQGHVMIDGADHSQRLANAAVFSAGYSTNATGRNLPLLLEPEKAQLNTGAFSTVYIGGAAGGAFNFGTGVLSSAAVNGGATTIPIDKSGTTSSIDGTSAFLPGDIIQLTDQTLIGTVSSVSDTALTLQDAIAGDGEIIADNSELFIKNPIVIDLEFER